MVTTQPTEIPTTDVTTAVPTAAPSVNESAVSSPVVDTPGVNETPEVPASNVTPVEQSLVTPQGILTTTAAPDNNLTVISPDQVSGNTTSSPVDTLSPVPDLNVTNTTPDATGPAATNYTWSDPPLNTSADNPYYLNNESWVIDTPGHTWVMDLNASNNTNYPANIQFDGVNTFSNFGPDFAILINASNVIFDGMGAILDGGGNTMYGIIVNNQTESHPDYPYTSVRSAASASRISPSPVSRRRGYSSIM